MLTCKLFSIHRHYGQFPLFRLGDQERPQFVPHVINCASPELAKVSPKLPQAYPHALKRILPFHLACLRALTRLRICWSSRDNEPTFARGRRTSGTRLGGSYFFVRTCPTVSKVSELSEPSLFDFVEGDAKFDSDNCVKELDDIAISAETVDLEIEIQRSKKRRKTCTAFLQGGKIIVQVPARMSQREVEITVTELVGRIKRREQIAVDPNVLMQRAAELVAKHLDNDIIGSHRVPVTIRWVTNQNSRWGSCTPGNGAIRLSHRLQSMPQYVQDAVLFHELIHLVVLRHNAEFYELANRYPEIERANAYLEGYAHARNN